MQLPSFPHSTPQISPGHCLLMAKCQSTYLPYETPAAVPPGTTQANLIPHGYRDMYQTAAESFGRSGISPSEEILPNVHSV